MNRMSVELHILLDIPNSSVVHIINFSVLYYNYMYNDIFILIYTKILVLVEF